MQSNRDQIWTNLENLSLNAFKNMAREHLEYSNYTVFGYWDEEDKFYDEITFKQPLLLELFSYSVGKTINENQNEYWIKLQFKLKSEDEIKSDIDNVIGEMTLILDPNFQFIDENWLINVNSPFVITKS